MRQTWCVLALVLNSQRKQLVHRKAHMKKLGALMFGFSNHGLFVSASSSQEHLACCNPCLPHITLPNIYPIKYVIKLYHNVYTWEGHHICIQLRSHRHFLTFESRALQAFVCSKQCTNIWYTHAQTSPRDGVRLGAASSTEVKSQWSLWELQGAQHFWKAEHLYLDS